MIKKIFILILLPFSLISQEKNAEYYANYASDSIGSGNFDLRLFVEYLTKAIELDSLNVDYYEQRSYAWQNLGDQIKAIEDFDKIISIYEQIIDLKIYLILKVIHMSLIFMHKNIIIS